MRPLPPLAHGLWRSQRYGPIGIPVPAGGPHAAIQMDRESTQCPLLAPFFAGHGHEA